MGEIKRIMLAIGHEEFENYLISRLKSKIGSKFIITDRLIHGTGIVDKVAKEKPHILVLRESLPELVDVMSVVHQIRIRSEHTRIIYLSNKRREGDLLLANLINYGVYDILRGTHFKADEIIEKILIPNKYADISHLHPTPSYDSEFNKVKYDNVKTHETKVVEKIKYVDMSTGEIVDEEEALNDKGELNNDIKAFSENEENPYIKSLSDKKQKNDVSLDVTAPKVKVKKKNPIEEFLGKINKGLVKEEKEDVDNNKKEDIKYKEPEVFIDKANKEAETVNTERIISFIGGKSGVGTTVLATNTAFQLAQAGNDVIFVELNQRSPTALYWYDLGKNSKGIDTALQGIENGEFQEVQNAITKSKDLKLEEDNVLYESYKKFPDSIDFMFFSKKYLAGETENISLENLKDLYLNLLFQQGYDYVVLDVPSDIFSKEILDVLIYSSKIFTVITQDIASIGYQTFNLNKLEEKGVNILAKNNYIVNKYVQAGFGSSDIKNWLAVEDLILIPNEQKSIIEGNYEGVPAIYRNKNFKRAISQIVKKI